MYAVILKEPPNQQYLEVRLNRHLKSKLNK